MPTRITLIYHAYKNFEVPNKIAKMINDGTISWRSHHDDIYYTDEDGKEQRVSSSSECVAWEGHDDYEVAESEEESDEESEEELEEESEEESEESLVEGVDYEVINSGIAMKEEKSDTK
jgi:hypothetical protein